MNKYTSTIYSCMQEKKNTHQIFQEIVKLGYSSSYANFFKQFKLRLMTNTLGNAYQLSRHNFCKLLYSNNIKKLKFDEKNEKILKEYLEKKNQESEILTMVDDFKKVFESKNVNFLNDWLNKYCKWDDFNELQTFIKGIKQDKLAVENQVLNNLTNDSTEGLVGKIKVIKRRTYGR